MKTLALLLSLLLISSTQLQAVDRIGIVIGNGSYTALHRLDDCPRDADLMATTFTSCGIRLQGGKPLKNLTLDQMDEALRRFITAVPAGAEVYVYYSGHGAQIDGINYLLPIDFDAKYQSQVKRKALALDDVLTQLESTSASLRVVMLDSCRDPGDLLTGEAPAKRLGKSKGLAEQKVDAPETLVCFATKHGTPSYASADGTNSYYTSVLAEEIVKPGKIEDVMKRVARGVYAKTSQQQLPFTYGSLLNDHFFVPGTALPDEPLKPKGDPLASATREKPFVNSLGMEFIPLPGNAGVFMCRTETRVRDFRAYARAADYVQTGGAYVMQVKKDKDGNPTGTAWELDTSASWEKPGFTQGEDHPVCCVSLNEAEVFCAWLSKKEGKTYRLPTDAEWSAAVGVGKYPWGSTWPPPKGVGNYAGTEFKESLPKATWQTAYDHSDGYSRTAPAASFEENRYGFYDLGGNVWEWCSDRYKASMNSQAVFDEFPALKKETNDDGTPFRVLRGGSWFDCSASGLLSSFRDFGHPTARDVIRGFRLVVVVGSGG
jgi:formylglycine-generating enzyme required for sulfatase activity